MRLKEIFCKPQSAAHSKPQSAASAKMLKSRYFCAHFQAFRKQQDYCAFLQIITKLLQFITRLWQDVGNL